MGYTEQLFPEGTKRTQGGQARRYNFLAARLIADLVKNSFGPRGLEKIFIDILGEVTVTKDGATLLRKIDVEHPAAKVIIEASNTVDNEVGDGTTSVVILAGALIKKAEELLDLNIGPSIIADGYLEALDASLNILDKISRTTKNADRKVMEGLVDTCLESKAISYIAAEKNIITKSIVDAICLIADFSNGRIEIDDIKIEEKIGNTSDMQLIKGVVLDKTIDNSAMARIINDVKILLINEELEGKRTKAEAEIQITLPGQIKSYFDNESSAIRLKVQNIINSGANVVISQRGINLAAQYHLANAGIVSIRRVKDNDMLWIEKSTGAKTIKDFNNIAKNDLGYAGIVSEKIVGEDRMVFIEECKNPKSVTLLLRANSKRILDEYHRSVLDAISVLADFIAKPTIVAGGGSVESIIAAKVRRMADSVSSRKQIVIRKFADALEEIPLTIARNAGMCEIDTLIQLRLKHSTTISYNNNDDDDKFGWYGVNPVERKIEEMLSKKIIEPSVIKEQVLKTAVEVTNLLVRVDDVLMAKPTMQTHTHDDGTRHSHAGGDKKHDHYFDKLGKKQRPMHHYY
ncbi:MAG: thermosome subunit alpha [Nitrososphaeraceae archaeon]